MEGDQRYETLTDKSKLQILTLYRGGEDTEKKITSSGAGRSKED
jgi:hypothetical protein